MVAVRAIKEAKYDLLILSLPCLASLAALLVSPNEWRNIIIYWAYYGLVVVPISYACSKSLLKDYPMSLYEKIALGYPAAIVVTIFWYLLVVNLNIEWATFLLPLCIIIWQVWDYTDKKQVTSSKNIYATLRSSVGISSVYIAASLVLFTTFTQTTYEPTAEFGSNVYEDTLWTIGNTWSVLKQGLPLQDIRFSDIGLGYHVGQNLYYAFTSTITSINPIALHLSIGPYYDLFFLCLGVISCSRVFIGATKQNSWIVAIPVLFCSIEITSFKVGASAEYHEIYSNPISIAFGLASFLILMALLSRQYFYGKANRSIPLLYSIILFMLAVSTKGILGVIVPGAVITLMLSRFFTRKMKINQRDLLLLASMFLTLVLFKLTMFNGSGGWIVMPQIEISPIAIRLAERVGLGDFISNVYFILGPLSRLVRFLFHTLFWNWVSISMILCMTIICAANRHNLINYQLMHLSLCFIWVCSILYGLNLMENYWANLYYYKYSFALLALQLGIISSFLLDRIFITTTKSPVKSALMSTGLIISLIPSYVSIENTVSWIGTESWKTDRGMFPTWRPNAFLSKDEFDGLEWMRNHLAGDSLIASDRKDKEGWSGDYIQSVWFAYSAYTGLKFFNEGDAFNKYSVSKVAADRWAKIQNILVSNNQREAEAAWQQVPAEYLIITQRISPEAFNKPFLGSSVFANKGIRVVKNPVAN